MAKKTTKKYYFSVEGETEHWYLKWIQDKINNTEQAICRVAIDCPVRKDPVKHAKCLNVTQKVEVYHFFDYESDEQAHVNAFMSAMDNMKKAERIGKQITYRSGYSRQMIEIGFLRGFLKKSQFSFLFFSKLSKYLADFIRN